MVDIRTPGNLEVIGPTSGHFTDGKTEVKRKRAMLEATWHQAWILGHSPGFLTEIRVLGRIQATGRAK